MKQKLLLIALLVFATTVFAFSQAKEIRYKNYNIKTGYIKYQLTGSQTGTQETYFTDWGLSEAKITKAKMDYMGKEQDINTTFVITTEDMVNFDRVTKQGVKFPKPDYSQVYKIWDEEGGNFEKVQVRLIENSGMVNIGNETILKRKCTIWQQNKDGIDIKIWSWNGIQLKIQQKMQGITITQTAVEIKENIKIDNKVFNIPKDISWTDQLGKPITK